MIRVLNFLHHRRYWKLLSLISRFMYFMKRFGVVKACYHPQFRAYEYKVNDIVYLSLGPGWAYSFPYLMRALIKTYNHFYLPAEGDCVIDIGSGLGEETVIYALLVGSSGTVHALEANPTTYSGLKYMVESNNFTWVKANHLAIYKSNGVVTIEDDEENYLTNTIHVSSTLKAGFHVKAITLDTLVRENRITRIDFLKSNIEGAEQYLIEGMDESVKLIKNICISCHDFRHIYHNHGDFYMTRERVKTFLIKNGFEIKTRNTGNRVIDDYIYARNPCFDRLP